MRIGITPRRKAFCIECREETVQWLREVHVPSSPGSFGRHSPILSYVCRVCGEENH